MLKKNTLWVAVVIIFLLSSSQVSAQVPISHSEHSNQFHRIEQPLGFKAAVTIGGIAFIGLELWWFIFSKSPVKKHE
jgi:plastocyanin domain-containing protein